MNKQIKGFFLQNIINIVQEQKGDEGVTQLYGIIGEEVKLSSIYDYPYPVNSKIINGAVEVLFGKYNINGQYELGKLVGRNYVNTSLGKTILTLFRNNTKNAINRMGYIEKVMGIESDIETEYLDQDSVKVHIDNDPFTYQFHEGFIEGLSESLGEKTKVHGRELSKNDHEYVVSWNMVS